MKLSLSEVFNSLARAVGAPRVLCADDDPAIRDLCSIALTKAGFVTDLAVDGRETLEKLQDNEYAAVLLDLSMPSVHGATVLSLVQREKPEILRRIIVVTGMPDAVVDGVRHQVAAVLRKPVSLEDLLVEVKNCTSRHPKARPDGPGEVTVRL
jgi:DNA-binding response OmpR family regulator